MHRALGAATLALAVVLVGAPSARAGDDPPAPAPAPSTSAVPDAEAPDAGDAPAVLAAIDADLKVAQDAWRAEYAKRPAGDAAKDWTPPARPEPGFVARYLAAAERFAGSEEAVPFLVAAAGLGRTYDADAAKRALATLVEHHTGSPRLAELTFTLLYGVYGLGEDTVVDATTRVAAATPHPDVKAAMLFVRGALVNRRGARSDEERAQAVADLRAAQEAAPTSRYAKMAEGTVYELEHLQVGMTAPDIEAADLDGVAFKLSDYRGKVVVLDFFGDW